MFPGESTEFIRFVFPISITKEKELGVVWGSGVEEGLLKTVKGVTFDSFGEIPCLANIFVAAGRLLFNLNTLIVLPMLEGLFFTALVPPFTNWDLRLFRPFSNMSNNLSMKPFVSFPLLETAVKPLPPIQL